MELGTSQLQIFISLVVILIAALVALICDFLKGNNEQLRELTIELKVRRDEERRYRQMFSEPVHASEPAPVTAVQQPVIAEAEPKRPNWSAVLARGAQAAKSSDKILEAFPTGYQDAFVLRRLANSRHQVTGLVVSIGLNTGGSIPDQVRLLIQSLTGPNDFACQSDTDEFVLVYPNQRGASAQRRLSEIAQQLWDFQLAAMGTFAIVFSWGGVEVQNETIDEAIAQANERMQETRRGRKLRLLKPAV